MDAVELLRKQQASNREQFAIRPQPSTQDLYRYIGFDAETGMAIASNGTDTIQAGRITNGAIKPNQPVKTTQSGNRSVIDAMPHIEPKPAPPEPKPSGNVKILFVRNNGTEIVVGGWRQPQVIAEYPDGTRIEQARIHNLGGDDWIASWFYQTLAGDRDVVVYQRNSEYRFSDTPEGRACLESLDTVVLGGGGVENLGFGLWRFMTPDPIVGTPTNRTQSVRSGYWVRGQADASGSGTTTTIIDAIAATSSYSTQSETAVYPERFEPTFQQNFKRGNDNDQTISIRRILAKLVNQQLNSAIVAIQNLWDTEIWLLSSEDQLLVRAGRLSTGLSLLSSELPFWNWTRSGHYYVNFSASVEEVEEVEEEEVEDALTKLKKQRSTLIVDRYRLKGEFSEMEDEPRVPEVFASVGKIRAKVEKLGQYSSILSASYHP
jgi:hypothetical protein